MWYFVALFAFPAFLFTAERLTTWMRKKRIEARRAKAEYPTSENDPVGRAFMGW